MKKRLISLMLTGAMLTGVGALSACGQENTNSKGEERDLTVAGQQYGNAAGQQFGNRNLGGKPYTYDDIYIVLEQNGKSVLHHGDAKELLNDADWINVNSSGNWLYDFDCCKPFAADWQHAFFDEKPSEDFYTEECEECAKNLD